MVVMKAPASLVDGAEPAVRLGSGAACERAVRGESTLSPEFAAMCTATQLGLEPCQPRPWRLGLTEASASLLPDLVARDFTATAPCEKMVGDITYIPTWEGWLYLATVIDCHTKAVIGWAMGDNYQTPLIEHGRTELSDHKWRDIPLRSRQ
jgi:hypothetical protein